MILATKNEVDEAKRAIVEEVDGLAVAIARWQANPTDRKRFAAADDAIQRAADALGEYELVLETWAAGPSGGDGD